MMRSSRTVGVGKRVCGAMSMAGVVLGLALGALAPGQAAAQDYPNKMIRLVVPYPAGGATDVAARLLATEMGHKLGQQVLVENRPGAAGSVGADYVVRQPADGYTLLFGGAGNITLRPLMHAQSPYQPERDLATISHVVTYDHFLVVRNDLAVKSVADLIKMAKDNPGKLTFGSSGTGGPQHLAMELFMSMAGVQMTHVPYKGEAPVVTDLVAGRIDMSIISTTAIGSYLKANRVRALASTNPYRSMTYPDVPLVSESGLPGYEMEAYGGVLAPVATPPAILSKLSKVIQEIVEIPAFKAKFHEASMFPIGSSPEQFADFLTRERNKWGPIIKRANVTID